MVVTKPARAGSSCGWLSLCREFFSFGDSPTWIIAAMLLRCVRVHFFCAVDDHVTSLILMRLHLLGIHGLHTSPEHLRSYGVSWCGFSLVFLLPMGSLLDIGFGMIWIGVNLLFSMALADRINHWCWASIKWQGGVMCPLYLIGPISINPNCDASCHFGCLDWVGNSVGRMALLQPFAQPNTSYDVHCNASRN